MIYYKLSAKVVASYAIMLHNPQKIINFEDFSKVCSVFAYLFSTFVAQFDYDSYTHYYN